MPKMKSHSGTAKRVKLTAKGKVRYKKAGKSHLLTHKTRSRKRQARRPGILNSTDEKIIKRLLPYA